VAATSLLGGILLGTRRLQPTTTKYITNRNIQIVCFVFMPLCIGLYFLAGRVTMQPMSKGVIDMNRFGCCSQGLVFPHDKAEELVEWYQQHDDGYVDVLTEEFADSYGLPRYALNPPALQHIGIRSSKNDDADWLDVMPDDWVTPANKLWNFAFEELNPTELKEAHEKAVAEKKPNP
jgi:hypothetical protein